MKNVRTINPLKIVWIVFICCSTHLLLGQKKSDQLRAEQEKLEKKLSNTKNLLEKVQTGAKASMNELKIIENQVKYREELVQNFDNQIRGAELTISSKDKEIERLRKRIIRLKKQYKSLLEYAYKKRAKGGKMMYVLSSKNYFEAVKRNAYLKHIGEIQRKQFKVIQQSQLALGVEIKTIQNEKTKKEKLLSEKVQEREKMLRDKEKRQKALEELQKNEQELMAELKADERQKAILRRRIQEAIEKEIAEAEQRAKKEREKALARERELKKKEEQLARQKAQQKNTSTTKSEPAKKTEPAPTETASTGTTKETLYMTETRENVAVGKSFETNRGNLPWPVAKGTITEAYGKNPHPTLTNVYTNNNGIDIGAPKNAQVRAVFEGEVTSVLNIPGAGKAVIIKHGSYRTVYSNLQDVFVSEGSKVSTKQTIGSLLPDQEGGLSTSHFEIHHVTESGIQRMNPSLWLAN